MSYIEIKAIKSVAALHRGVVNTAIRTLGLREKLAAKRLQRQTEYACDLYDLACKTASKSVTLSNTANYTYQNTIRSLRSAEHTVLNLRDDLNKIQ